MYYLCKCHFSYSCGYRKAYEEYANIIQERYPDIILKGANYEPAGFNFLLSKAILAAKMVLILIIVSSYDIWAQLGQGIPTWYQWCTDNKIYACMMVFFVGNMLEAQVSVNKNNKKLTFLMEIYLHFAARFIGSVRNKF